MKAVVVQEPGKAILATDVPVPEYTDDEVLVAVKAVSHNPTGKATTNQDWKHVKWISEVSSVCGCDFSGIVSQVGKNVTKFKVGDRIAGAVHGGRYPDKGSFAEFTPADPLLCFHIPAHMSFEEASVYGVCAGTAAACLFQKLGLNPPSNPYTGAKRPKVLIWGAGSYCGVFAVQLAKLAGIRVVATASEYAFPILKELGAEAVFDYRDPKVSEKILEWADNELIYGMDCISEDSTVPLASRSMTSGMLVCLLTAALKHKDINPNVTMTSVLLYQIFNKPFNFFGQSFPASLPDYEFGKWWQDTVSQLVADKKLKTPRITILEGGLSAFQEGFDTLEQGKIRMGKLVMRV